MDLVLLVAGVSLVGFLVWLITTKVPMAPYWAAAIQVFAAVMVVLYLAARLGVHFPNLLPWMTLVPAERLELSRPKAPASETGASA